MRRHLPRKVETVVTKITTTGTGALAVPTTTNRVVELMKYRRPVNANGSPRSVTTQAVPTAAASLGPALNGGARNPRGADGRARREERRGAKKDKKRGSGGRRRGKAGDGRPSLS